MLVLGAINKGISWEILRISLNSVSLKFNGESNSATGFEMLNALKPGINYVWDFSYQRLISKNLQISIHYNGRKSEGSTIIHSGNMEIRALF